MIVVDGVEMVDVREAAELSRRTPETIRRWVWSGRLRSVKNGNKLFVRRADLTPTSGAGSDEEPTLTLKEWAKRLPTSGDATGVSARDLVLEDRDARAGR